MRWNGREKVEGKRRERRKGEKGGRRERGGVWRWRLKGGSGKGRRRRRESWRRDDGKVFKRMRWKRRRRMIEGMRKKRRAGGFSMESFLLTAYCGLQRSEYARIFCISFSAIYL